MTVIGYIIHSWARRGKRRNKSPFFLPSSVVDWQIWFLIILVLICGVYIRKYRTDYLGLREIN
jgi:hypothetical protein